MIEKGKLVGKVHISGLVLYIGKGSGNRKERDQDGLIKKEGAREIKKIGALQVQGS